MRFFVRARVVNERKCEKCKMWITFFFLLVAWVLTVDNSENTRW